MNWGKLTGKELDKCAERVPAVALRYAADRLTAERRAECKRRTK